MKIIKILKQEDVLFCKGYRNLNLKDSFKRRMPLIRILGANSLTFISNITTNNFKIRDVTNGLFGMKSEVLKKINLINLRKNYFFEQDLIFNICKKKIKIQQVNSEVIYDNETSSLNILKSILPFLFYHFQNIFKK